MSAVAVLGVSAAATTLPPLKITAPVNGATVGNPLVVVIETPADLAGMTMGGHTMKQTAPHLHVDLDTRVTMPTMKHLTRVGAGRYRFSFGRVAAGSHTIRVYWADAEKHQSMGTVQTVTVTVK